MAEYELYQLPLTGAEIQSALTGAVVANGAQNLSEAEKAQARANIGATAAGNGIRILGHFDTLAELKDAVTEPKAGDAFSVGADTPYNLYLYDAYRQAWVDYGPIRATDVSARFAQDLTVAISDWVEDTDVFVDYTYKAAIPIDGITANALPIVVFSPTDALSGNFCPMAYTFDGYLEIFAKAVPAEDIVIPAITFLIEGSA